jgi:hypothetical protein
MKQISSMLIAALSLLTFSNTVTAQKDTSEFKTWNDVLARIKKDKKPGASADPKLKAISEQWVAGITKSVSSKPATEPWKEWTPTHQQTSGEINLLPLMEEAPAPIYILSLAGQADLDAKYDPYIKKLESQQRQLAESVAKNSKLQQVYQKEGEEGVKKRAIAESDKSKMVQQMGGTENLMNMSEAERKAAAMKMASEIKSNPTMLSGNNNPGMNALMQKVMNDKEYAKRFNKMSDAEKEAEVKKFMTENSQEQDGNFDATRSNQQYNQLMAERDNTKYTQDITLLNMRIQKRLGTATELYSKNVLAINAWVENVRKKIGTWYGAKYAAIPIVELGEYGHDKDPEQVQALNITVAYLTYQMIQGPEMKLRSDNWVLYKTNCKYAIGELNDFIASYKWGSHTTENIFGPDADQQVVSGIGLAYGMMNQLAEEAKAFSTTAKGYQKQFETITTGR